MHELWITEQLNHMLGGPANALLNLVGVHAKDTAFPITDPVAMQFMVALVMLTFFALIRRRLSIEAPGRVQQVAEMLVETFSDLCKDTIGHHSSRYVPYVTTLFVFVLVSNLIGLVPGFLSPTQFAFVPLGCAIMTFVYYHFHGVRQQGVLKYLKHFAGPIWWLSWLMFPIEIISHTARVMSLTVRLFANMYAGELLTLVFFSLVPIGVPLIFQGMHLIVGSLQAFIFAMLTIIYLAGAVAEEH